MTDYTTVAPPTRTCAGTGIALNAGDRFVAALIDTAGKFERKDFAATAWTGPPSGTIAFWTGKIPPDGAPKRPAVNDGMLLDWFHHLADTPDPARANVRYVVALLLMRRKRLKFEDLRRSPGGDVLVLRDAKSGTRHELPDPRLTDDEIAAVQDEVFRALGW